MASTSDPIEVDADTCVDVSDDGCQAACRAAQKNKWSGVRGRPGIMTGAYQFEVLLEEPCLLRVGWSAIGSGRVVGMDAQSFGYGGTAMISTNRKFQKYGEEFHQTPGAIVTCLLDRRDPTAETISFCLNGRNLGIAFTLPAELADVPLFPAICGKEAWCANFLGENLAFPQEGFGLLQDALDAGEGSRDGLVNGLRGDDADLGISLSEDRCSIACRPEASRGAWYGIRGRPGVLRGMYQFEVELVDDSLLRIGWAGLRSKRVIGNDARSFGYGGTGKKSTGGAYGDYGESFQGRVGAVVSCLISRGDADHQTISYAIDGQPLGVAFELSATLADIPLFPAICGKGAWQAVFRSSDLRFPMDEYQPLSRALAKRDAVAGEVLAMPEAPRGLAVLRQNAQPGGADKTQVRVQTSRRHDRQAELEAIAKAGSVPVEGVTPGRRVVLHVHSGPWQGWYSCRVADTDPMGCYLRHESDGFTENVPWGFLNAGKYSMELLPDDEPQEGAPTAGSPLMLELEEQAAQQHEEQQVAEGQKAVRQQQEATDEHLAVPGAAGEAAVVQSPHGCVVEGPVAAAAAAAVDQSQGVGDQSSLLRWGKLRVHSDLGAGMTLVMCELGYFVSRVDQPGQPDLRRGDVIVAIGGCILLGLVDSELEDAFGAAFEDGAHIVAGRFMELRRRPFGEVRQEAEVLSQDSPKPGDEWESDRSELLTPPHPAALVGRPSLAGLVRSLSEQGASFIASLLQRTHLQVDVLTGEAGLELSACQAGYLIDQVHERPGQPDLKKGDVIVAIGSCALTGLEPEDLEERFGGAFGPNAMLWKCSMLALTVLPLDVVHHELQRFLEGLAGSTVTSLARATTC